MLAKPQQKLLRGMLSGILEGPIQVVEGIEEEPIFRNKNFGNEFGECGTHVLDTTTIEDLMKSDEKDDTR